MEWMAAKSRMQRDGSYGHAYTRCGLCKIPAGEPKDIQATVSRDRKGMIQQIFAAYDYGNLPVTIEACWDYPEAFPFEMYYRIKLEEATIVFSSSASPSLVVYPNAGGRIVPELEKEFESENDIGEMFPLLGDITMNLSILQTGFKCLSR